MFNGRVSDAPAVRSRPCASCASRGITVFINGKQRSVPATRILFGGSGRCENCYKNKIEPLVTGETNEPRAETTSSH